jgi:hypothetical protein
MHLLHTPQQRLLLLIVSIVNFGYTAPECITYAAYDKDPYTKKITLTFDVPDKDCMYKDFITCSVDHPAVLLSPWKANKQTISYFDPSSKETKLVFNEPFTVSLTATRTKITDDPLYLYCSYYRQSEKKINHVLFPLIFTLTETTTSTTIESIAESVDTYDLMIKPNKKTTYVEHYILLGISIAQIMYTSLRTDHRKYCALLIFLIIVLIAFYSFFKQELQKQTKLRELLTIIIFLLVLVSITYFLYALRNVHITCIAGITASLYFIAGIFYTKKSTLVISKNLRTLCTFLGMLCICLALLLAFKTVHYADEQFHLFFLTSS